ncbi:MAG TPA: tetratricopeptide repeat protein [Pyrinomonadaceae bacterium]|jgi:tetratricopeptide (TPR) repeat protein|nr:tetratricopeptide repeat protein [Pyrinomonadaceae bacterium]
MSQERIEALLLMAEAQPQEAMVWYGLANEYFKLTRWQEAAEALARVVELNADYTSAHQMLGSALSNLGRHEEARRAWTQGIEVANRTGAWKARQHMEGLLAGAQETQETTGLCAE